MLSRFRDHLRSSGLIPDGASVLVAYSGGADSTCLLHLLHASGVDIAAAHLHHGQRPEADNELKLCEAFCADMGIPFASGRADVPRLSRDLKIGLEEAGRKARYSFLSNTAFRLSCGFIATAHTRSDNVETILLNLTRGSGMNGLAGIPAHRGNIIRPLLPFSREETRGYCDSLGLWYHDDPANSDLSFSRARIRHRVIKELRTINSNFDAAAIRLAETVGEEDRFLDGMAAAALEQSEIKLNGALYFLTLDCEVSFQRAYLGSLPPVLFRRSMRLAVQALGGAFDHRQTEAVREGVAGSEKGSVTCAEGVVAVEWNAESLHLRKLGQDEPFRHPLTVPGETVSEDFGWTLVAAPSSYSSPIRAAMEAPVDAAKLKGQLYFRTIRDGDEMQPLGFGGHRKLSDILSEAKLSRAARNRLPIICDMVGPIWAPGVCLHDRVAASPEARNVLLLRFGPTKET